jgi:hypothetical protein
VEKYSCTQDSRSCITKAGLFHPRHLSLSSSFDIISHTQSMFRSCILMSCLCQVQTQVEAHSCRPASPLSLLARRVCSACDLPPQDLFCSCTHALHHKALPLLAAWYPLLPISGTGAESFGATGAKDSPPIGATGAAHLQVRLDRKGCPPPGPCASDSSSTCFLPTLSQHSPA